MSKSFIKQAEQNVLNQAKFWSELIEFLTSFGSGLQRRVDRYSPGKDDFSQGVSLLLRGAYKEQQHALARCFVLSGVGGEEAQAFARERALEVFDDQYALIQWLDEWCLIPSSWAEEEEQAFKKELKARLQETKKNGDQE